MNHASTPVDLPVAEVLRRRQVRAVFQPVVNVADGSLAGYEALARVGPGDGGLPGEWLAAADAAGLRAELELLCLEVVAAAGRPPGGGLLFVNSSLATLFDERVLDLRGQLTNDLVIDLTEHDPLAAADDLAERLAPLIGSGVRLAIDDSTSATFVNLLRVRPSFVKLDQHLVRGIHEDPERQALVAAIVRFGDDTGFATVAEGVEQPGELEALQAAGVPLAQGYLLGRPVPRWDPPAQVAVSSARTTSMGLEHGLRQRLARSGSMQEASEVVTDALSGPHLFVAVYVERSGQLRCLAQRGFWQVLDGIPVTVGITGRAHRTGTRTVVHDVNADPDHLESRPDVVAKVVEPLLVGGTSVGCLDVESDRPFDGEALTRVSRFAQLLAERLARVGLRQDESALTRLARSSKELAGLSDEIDLERAVVRLACEVAGMSSAALALPGERSGITLRAAKGPLSAAFRALDRHDMEAIVARVTDVSSLHARGHDTGPTVVGLDRLRQHGAATIAVLPMRLLGRGTGLLFVAEDSATKMDAEDVEAIELLATEAARSFDLANLVAELRDRATRDPITGLQNQRAFEEMLTALGGRRAGRWAVVMADIDGFKAVNDTHGHPTGDRLLRELAAALNDAMRPMDRLYRVGGDEFAAVLSQLDAVEAHEVGQRLSKAADGVLGDYGAALSIGIALPRVDEAPGDFLARADASLYEAKRSGRGSVRLSDP